MRPFRLFSRLSPVLKAATPVVAGIFLLSMPGILPAAQSGAAKEYRRGRLTRSNGQVVHFRTISFDAQLATLNPVAGGEQPVTLEMKNISEIEIKKGNHALEIGGISALLGLAAGLLASLETESSEDVDEVSATLLATAICGGIGALIGLAVPKWRTVYNYSERHVAPVIQPIQRPGLPRGSQAYTAGIKISW